MEISQIRLTATVFFSASGILKGYDALLNLVLDNAVEYLRGTFLILIFLAFSNISFCRSGWSIQIDERRSKFGINRRSRYDRCRRMSFRRNGANRESFYSSGLSYCLWNWIPRYCLLFCYAFVFLPQVKIDWFVAFFSFLPIFACVSMRAIFCSGLMWYFDEKFCL